MGDKVAVVLGVGSAVALAREGVGTPLAEAHSEARLVAEPEVVAQLLPRAVTVPLLLPLLQQEIVAVSHRVALCDKEGEAEAHCDGAIE